jgi:hypothetical protein
MGQGWATSGYINHHSCSPIFHYARIIEGSLEVKLPTIWTDRKAEVGRAEKRREEKKKEERRLEKRKESEERRCRCAKR